MANPSTVPASSAGTEILRRSYANGLTNSNVKIIDGDANYTYTVLSLIFCSQSTTNTEEIHMWIDIEDSGTEIWLLHGQTLPPKATFVWENKIMLSGTDELIIKTDSAGDTDVYCTYIEQRWA